MSESAPQPSALDEAMEQYRDSTLEHQKSFIDLAREIAKQDEIDFPAFALLAAGHNFSPNNKPDKRSFSKEAYPHLHKICKNLGAMATYEARSLVMITDASGFRTIGRAPDKSELSGQNDYYKFKPKTESAPHSKLLVVDAQASIFVPVYSKEKRQYIEQRELKTVGSFIVALEARGVPAYIHSNVVTGTSKVLRKCGEEGMGYHLNTFIRAQEAAGRYFPLYRY